jgi:hypothetical protein
MNKYTLIPSGLQYSSAPEVDQEISISLEEQKDLLIEYDRSATISLAQVYDDERQASTVFRPTFKVNYLYNNTFTGTTTYLPFQYNLYYVDAPESKISGIWKGFPQYFEFDFFRPNLNDSHFNYRSKSAYTYNWTYYITYCSQNNENQPLLYSYSQTSNVNWVAKDGIPFFLLNSTYNGSKIISFKCIATHGLSVGEWVELSFDYFGKTLFQVNLLGDGTVGSEKYIFSIYNVGYKPNVFVNGKTGTFKRIINVANLTETKSKYYIRQNKVLTNADDIIAVKNGFEKNVFRNQEQYEYSSITPNNVARISRKTSSDSFNFTLSRDIDINGLLDNQKRPISELFLTIINKGYSGYFNYPNQNVGLKRGWKFNIDNSPNPWWDYYESRSNSNIQVDSYSKTNGAAKTFYYNRDLKIGDIIDGDFCEWNNYEQSERVISPCFHKIKFNEDVFQTVDTTNQDNQEYATNAPGYYYQPHHKLTIRVFSDAVETAPINSVDNIPSYAYYSSADREFRWRDLYTYGFIDNLERGVDYPYLNSAHYPFGNIIFRLIPEGTNFSETTINYVEKPLIDDCE